MKKQLIVLLLLIINFVHAEQEKIITLYMFINGPIEKVSYLEIDKQEYKKYFNYSLKDDEEVAGIDFYNKNLQLVRCLQGKDNITFVNFLPCKVVESIKENEFILLKNCTLPNHKEQITLKIIAKQKETYCNPKNKSFEEKYRTEKDKYLNR